MSSPFSTQAQRKKENYNILTPSLAAKLGSIAQHALEGMGTEGHPFDLAALEALFADNEVMEWMHTMDQAGLLPVRRANKIKRVK